MVCKRGVGKRRHSTSQQFSCRFVAIPWRNGCGYDVYTNFKLYQRERRVVGMAENNCFYTQHLDKDYSVERCSIDEFAKKTWQKIS